MAADDAKREAGRTAGRAAGRAAGLRARIRAEMTDEIKQTARRHLASGGAPALSLRAVARDVGLVSSAIYRYFPSRDDLLTALILDAYNDMGAFVESAEAAVPRRRLLDRFLAAGQAVREWALAHPHEYALTYGTPVPGYSAPEDTVGPASRVTGVLTRILVDGHANGQIDESGIDPPDTAVDVEVRRIATVISPGLPAAVLARGLVAWTTIFGAVSFEVFGRLNNVIEDRRSWFDYQLRTMAALVGLRTPTVR